MNAIVTEAEESETLTVIGETLRPLLTDEMGAKWKGNIRKHPYRSHVIYYRIRKSDILILRVRSGRMKEPRLS